MSPLSSLLLVAGRELRETFRRKSYWTVLGLLVVGATLAVGLPDVIGGDDDRTTYDVAVVGATDSLVVRLGGAGAAIDADIEVRTVVDGPTAERLVADDVIDLALIAGSDPAPTIVVEEDHDRLVILVQQVVATEQLTAALGEAGVSPDEVAAALDAPRPAVRHLDEGRESRRGGASILSLLVYFLLIVLMVQVANGVAIEKSNRISEVLLAVVRPGPLMFGKVLGVGVSGLLTTLAVALPVLVKAALGGDLPDGMVRAMIAGSAWLVLGIALYLTMAAAVGAMVERQEETGSATAPLNGALIGAYVVAQSAPESTLATVLAYVPLTSPLVVPVRLAIGVSSTVEVVVSLVLSVVSVIVVGRLGAVIYRRAIVRTGRRLKLAEVLR
ncbi:MAG: ABC transporter permease [Actinomycetota bacterium]|nr:ABC transporter permease [Actinomycetota bacterium]